VPYSVLRNGNTGEQICVSGSQGCFGPDATQSNTSIAFVDLSSPSSSALVCWAQDLCPSPSGSNTTITHNDGDVLTDQDKQTILEWIEDGANDF
jgi:hypothetical protein